jgi:peptidoglycan/LPS O-acetylase OafA/YrhL
MPELSPTKPVADYVDPPVRAGKVFFPTLDAMRGVGAALIVLRHAPSMFHPIVLPESYLAVDLFFILSGVVIGNAYENRLLTDMPFLRFCWIRICRFYPLYALGCLLGVVTQCFGFDGGRFPGWLPALVIFGGQIFPGFTPGRYSLDGPCWSLAPELVGNALYAKFIDRISDGFVRATLLITWPLLLIYALVMHAPDLDLGPGTRMVLGGFLRFAFTFPIGLLIYRYLVRDRRLPELGATPKSTILSWLVMAGVLAVLACPVPNNFRLLYGIVTITVVLPALVFAGVRLKPTKLSDKIFRFLGATSYAVYVLHMPITTFIRGISERFGHNVRLFAPISGLAVLVCLLLLCAWMDSHYDAPLRKRMLAWVKF